MADAAARREARQRKIAENAESRMQRIMNLNGKHQEAAVTKNVPEAPHSDCHSEAPAVPKLHIEPDLDAFPHAGDSQMATEFPAFGMQLKQPPQKSAIYRKLILLLLGFALRYTNLVFENGLDILGIDLSYLHMGTIFVPFLIYEVTEYFVSPPIPEVNMTMNLMLKVNNIHGRGVDLVVNLLNHLLRLLKDMGVYFFAFVFLDMVFAVFKVDDDVV